MFGIEAMRRLVPTDYAVDAVTAAKALVGAWLCRRLEARASSSPPPLASASPTPPNATRSANGVLLSRAMSASSSAPNLNFANFVRSHCNRSVKRRVALCGMVDLNGQNYMGYIYVIDGNGVATGGSSAPGPFVNLGSALNIGTSATKEGRGIPWQATRFRA